MKVIFVNRYFHPDHSATSQLLSDLAFFLGSEGREVHVITSRQRYDDASAGLPAFEQLSGVAIHRVWTSRLGRGSLPGRALDYLTFYAGAAWAVLLLASRGDVVVAKTDPPMLSLAVWPAAWLRGAKLVNWLQDIFPEIAGVVGMRWAKGAAGKILASLRDWTLRAAASNIVLGAAMREYLLSRGVSANRVRVIPNWADGDIYPLGAAENELRAAWGLKGKFVVGYSGNMGRVHEFETLLAAAARLRNEDKVVFLFIGGGARQPWIEARARELGLSNVQFQPYQPRNALGRSLSAPDAHLITLVPGVEGFVFPSKLYGILAAGRPVILVGREAEIARLIGDAQCGMVVEPGDDAALAAAITRLQTGATTAQRCGANARRLFEERFEKRMALAAWRSVLDGLIGRR